MMVQKRILFRDDSKTNVSDDSNNRQPYRSKRQDQQNIDKPQLSIIDFTGKLRVDLVYR